MTAVLVSAGLTLATSPSVAAVPGANGPIAFNSDRTGETQIYTVEADGTGLTRITDNAFHEDTPAWSPDRSEIAFGSNRSGAWDLYTMNADGTGVTKLTESVAGVSRAWEPAWSPDGSKIAFWTDRDSSDEVYVMNADGSNETRLTTEGGVMPDWSPDGTQIAFTSTRDGNGEVYVMDADGTDQTRLTEVAGGDRWPTWSPDGTRIAFTSARDGGQEIYVMDADGTDQTRLTQSPGFNYQPAWSPDGTRIAFASARDGDPGDLWVMNADGTGETQITDSASVDERPDWSAYDVALARPDGRIKKGFFGTNVGNNIYNTTGTNQTRSGSAARGSTVTYYVSVQNDAPFRDVLRLKGTATNTRFRVAYTAGGTNITSQVTAGTYTTPSLAPRATFTVKVVVTVRGSAPTGSSLTGTLTAKSDTDRTIKDTVKFVTSRA